MDGLTHTLFGSNTLTHTHTVSVLQEKSVDELEPLQRVSPALRVEEAVNHHILSAELNHLPWTRPDNIRRCFLTTSRLFERRWYSG